MKTIVVTASSMDTALALVYAELKRQEVKRAWHVVLTSVKMDTRFPNNNFYFKFDCFPA